MSEVALADEQGARWLRSWTVTTTALIVLAIGLALTLHPAALATRPLLTIGSLTILGVLLATYLVAALRAQSNVAVFGGRIGLVVAIFWALEVLAANSVTSPGWSIVLIVVALLGVIGTTALAGYAGPIDSAWSTGVLAGMWSGLVSAPVAVLTMLAVLLLIPETGAGGVTGDDILAGVNHLWLGPLLGAAVGGIAGWARGGRKVPFPSCRR
jgi:hypothetical protein